MQSASRRKIYLGCWAVLTVYKHKWTWYWNNLRSTKKYTCATFFHLHKTKLQPQWDGSKGTNRGFFSLFLSFLLFTLSHMKSIYQYVTLFTFAFPTFYLIITVYKRLTRIGVVVVAALSLSCFSQWSLELDTITNAKYSRYVMFKRTSINSEGK